MTSFKDLRIVDNFYQTSLFYPMPTICISTVNEDGSLNVGSYSLCFPYYIAGKERYAMLLECRNNSNTGMNILRTGKCALNFITDEKETFHEAVRLGYPGPSAEKMKDFKWKTEKGIADPRIRNGRKYCPMHSRSWNAPGQEIWKGRTDSLRQISMTDMTVRITISMV